MVAVLEGGAGVTWYHWRIIEKVEKPSAMAGEEHLLFGTFDNRGKVDVVGFFELLPSLGQSYQQQVAEETYMSAHNIGQLCLCN